MIGAGTAGFASANSSWNRWNAAVVDLAQRTEQLRGLTFKRPVSVTFLSDAKFQKRLAGESRPSSASDIADQRRSTEELDALGVVPPGTDLSAEETKTQSSDTDGEYDSHTKRISIRGEDLSEVSVRKAVVHELTHALQDQYFDLNSLEDETSTSGQDEALASLVEGDAVRMEDDYTSSLPSNSQQNQGQGQRGVQPGAPEVIDVLSSVPYVLGPDMLAVASPNDANGAVNKLFRHPPATELQFLDPITLLTAARFVTVPTPKLGVGEVQDGPPDDFGAFSLYLTLAGRVDQFRALEVADGWGGGSQIQFKKGTTPCVRANITGRSSPETAAIAEALSSWARSMRPGTAQSSLVQSSSAGSLVTFTACWTPLTPGPVNSLETALSIVDERNSNVAGALQAGSSPAVAECDGNLAIADPALLRAERDAANSAGPPPNAIRHLIESHLSRIGRTCGQRAVGPS